MKIRTVKNAKEKKTFILTTNDIDADLERMNIDGLDLERFKQNPIMLYQHNSNEFPIGRWKNIKKWKSKITAEPEFAEDDFSQQVKYFVENDIIKGASIGFMPKRIDKELPRDKDLKEQALNMYGRDYIRVFDTAELYEASLVNIPSNPNAVSVTKSLKNIDEDKLAFYEKYIKREKQEEDKLKELENIIEDLEKRIEKIEKKKTKNQLLNIIRS